MKPVSLLLAFAVLVLIAPAQARTLCTLIADPETRSVLLSEGDCESPVTPASTFKVPLAVMGFDAGVLKSAHDPVLPFRQGYPDWGGAPWQRDNDPLSWMTHSTLWYSQRLTEQLGAERFASYVTAFGYGNADLSGDPGQNNGLQRSWISSSLRISPLEQAGFMASLLKHQLPVSPDAQALALSLVQPAGTSEGWTIYGKTGSAYPRNSKGNFIYSQGWGWYLGWAQKGDTRLVLVRLNQDNENHDITAGWRARDEIVAEWPALLARIGR